MRTVITFVVMLVVAFVVASTLIDSGTGQYVLTGTVGEYVDGNWILIGNATTDPRGVRISMREATVFEGDPALIEPGIRKLKMGRVELRDLLGRPIVQ